MIPRSRRGYTIVEVTLVAAVSALLLIGVFRWLTGVGGVVSENLSSAALHTLDRASEQIGIDVAESVHCSPFGTDARIVNVTPYVYTDGVGVDTPATLTLNKVESGGSLIQVTWRINGSDPLHPILERTEVPLDANCVPSPVTTWTAWVRDVDVTTSTLTTVVDGAPTATGTAGLNCTDEWQGACRVEAIDVTLKLTGDEFLLHRVFPLP